MAASARLSVRVTPRADVDRVGPFADGVLQVRVRRPPADGEANDAVRALLARALAVPRSSILLMTGAQSRTKHFAIDGLSSAELAARLSAIGN
jgi:uncharacterized protein